MTARLARMDGKVAVVTGASRGIGEAIARRLAAEGAKVVIASRKQEALDPVAAQIREAGGECLAIACHTGQPDAVEALVARTVEELGQIDVVVNNAATNPYFGPLMSVEDRAWDKTFEVNVRGYFLVARAVAKHLLERGAPGAIINVTSVLGTMAAPMQGVYGMTKAAVISLTKTLAFELGGAGIRVNAIAPGLIETRFSQSLVGNEEILKSVLDRCGIKRVGQPEDIAGAAAFLASDDAAYVSGEVLTVDGGWTTS